MSAAPLVFGYALASASGLVIAFAGPLAAALG
jgi:hypothetical protein